MKLPLTALVASIGFVALGSSFLGTSTAKAEPRHWFYNDYGYYDGRAYPNRGYGRRRYDDRVYYEDEYYNDDDYVVYEQPRRRHKKKRKWIEKRVRDAVKFVTKSARKKERKRARRRERARRLERRASRQRLYDARRGSGWRSGGPQTTTRIYAPTNRKVRKVPSRVKLAYVPLPRMKPYHLIPTNLANLTNLTSVTPVTTEHEDVKNDDVRKITLDGKKPAGSFDDRPSLTSSVKKPVEPVKKEVSLASKPDKSPNKSVSKPVEVKPIRIEIKKRTASKPKVFKPEAKKVKAKKVEIKKVEIKKAKVKKVEPKKIEFKKVEIKKPKIKKTRTAANQLSCDKAKNIVTDFGFSDVSARTCTGNVYDFNAKRDGKPYSVKVSSLSGELKGVKKIK